MIPADALLNAFLDANILLVVTFLFWTFVRVLMRNFGLSNTHATELRLLNAVFLAIVFSPFLMLAFRCIQSLGIATDVNINLSDMVVSHYLSGGFDMDAARVERMVFARDTLILNLLNGAGWMALCLIGLFLAGLVVGCLQLLVSVACLRRVLAEGFVWRSIGRVQIRFSDRTSVPFSTRGIWTYYIVIPSSMLGLRDELRVSLAHEFQHIRQGDIDWEILLEVLRPLFFLNPIFHAWKLQVEELRELTCDQAVLVRGRVGVREYCDTLLSVSQRSLQKDCLCMLAVAKVALVTAERSTFKRHTTALERRVLCILDAGRATCQRRLFVCLILPLASIVFVTALAIQSPGDWSQDRLTLSTVVNLERLDKINQLSTFGKIRD